jgi:Family of unknown function (DUF5681)
MMMSMDSALAVNITKITGGRLRGSASEINHADPNRQGDSGRFKRGQSGNPHGRPRGSRNHSYLNLHQIILDDAEAIIGKIVQAALDGDMAAGKMLLDRILPKRNCRPLLGLTLPAIASVADACSAMAAITNAALEGVISTSEAADLSQVVENFRRIRETTELEMDVRLLKERLQSRGL